MTPANTFTRKVGYQFQDPALLQLALTHRSASGRYNNERLEFLGDSILSLVIAEALYQRFHHAKEGDLSRLRADLVQQQSLADIAITLGMGEHLALGPGEHKTGGHRRSSILSDAVEALIGAIYLDGGLDAARTCVLTWFANRLDHVDLSVVKDAKTRLQEYLQAHHLPLPIYEVVTISGDAHAQQFRVRCGSAYAKKITEGTGVSRRQAEQQAAQAYLTWLENKPKKDPSARS